MRPKSKPFIFKPYNRPKLYNDEALIYEGHWNNDRNDYPEFPMVVAAEDLPDKAAILKRLADREALAARHKFYAFSTCRCCGQVNGDTHYQHGRFIWPDGFRHYIEVHNIKPSDVFLDFLNTSQF